MLEWKKGCEWVNAGGFGWKKQLCVLCLRGG